MLYATLFALFLVIFEQFKMTKRIPVCTIQEVFFLQISKNIFDLFAFSLFFHSE